MALVYIPWETEGHKAKQLAHDHAPCKPRSMHSGSCPLGLLVPACHSQTLGFVSEEESLT